MSESVIKKRLRCVICTHKDAEQINEQLLRGISVRSVGKSFDLNFTTLGRHRSDCIPQAGLVATEKQGVDVWNALGKILARMERLSQACEARLIDPDDPTRFTLDAHDDEVMIIWRDLRDRDETGKPIRKRSTLRELIAHVEGYETVEVTSTARGVEDARKLIIEATREIRAQLEMVAKLQGLFQQDKKNEADVENDRQFWLAQVQRLREERPDWDETAIREAIRLASDGKALQYLM